VAKFPSLHQVAATQCNKHIHSRSKGLGAVADRGSRAAAKGEGRGIEELVAFRMQSAYGSKEPGSCIGEKDAVKKCKVTHIFFIRPSRLARVPANRERERGGADTEHLPGGGRMASARRRARKRV